MEEINIWELGSRINVRLDGEFYSTVKCMIKSRYISLDSFYEEFKKHQHISFSVLKDRLKPGYKYFVDLEIYILICKILNIPLEEMQKHIIAYKTRRGSNYIENPILPIKITPIFDMLVAHHIGDGNVINPKHNRKPYFSYRQYDQHYKLLYLKKIAAVFGTLRYDKEYFSNTNNTKVYGPVVIADLMFSVYNLDVNSFKTEIALVPKELLKKNWKHELSFLIGIIIDEGHVDSNLIVIRMKNHNFIKGLREICSELSYTATLKLEDNGFACLYILSSSLSKFYKDYLVLLTEYPEVDLGYKGSKIREFIDRINKPKIYRPGNVDVILKLLSKEELTVNELASRLRMTRQGARYLIHKLEKENKVEVKSVVKFANWKYGVK
jgi:hypothetical protein